MNYSDTSLHPCLFIPFSYKKTGSLSKDPFSVASHSHSRVSPFIEDLLFPPYFQSQPLRLIKVNVRDRKLQYMKESQLRIRFPEYKFPSKLARGIKDFFVLIFKCCNSQIQLNYCLRFKTCSRTGVLSMANNYHARPSH